MLAQRRNRLPRPALWNWQNRGANLFIWLCVQIVTIFFTEMPCPPLMSTRYRFRFWNLFYFNVLWYVWAWELILFVECRQGNEKQHTHARASPTLPWLHDHIHDTLTHALSAQCLCSKNLDRTGRVKEFRHVLVISSDHYRWKSQYVWTCWYIISME